MRPAKSSNSLATTNHQQANELMDRRQPASSVIGASSVSGPTSPICRCRVMYLGSSVPHITKDGLQGIQEPLRELYPDKASLGSGNAGIDSWLSVWSNGILIENVDDTGREVKRFFKIDALHYCAAVKYVPSASDQQQQQLNRLPNGNNNNPAATILPKFLPLDSPHARQANSNPPIFASIIRRTTGIKVLECHAFICKREAAANALVRCCFHAYADTMYAKQIGADVNSIANDINNNAKQQQRYDTIDHRGSESLAGSQMGKKRSKSIAALNEADQSSIYANNRVPNSSHSQTIDRHSVMRRQSLHDKQHQNSGLPNHCDNTENGQKFISDNSSNNSHQSANQEANQLLRKQHQKLSKSMHQLNGSGQQNMGLTYNQLMRHQQREQAAQEFDGFSTNKQSTSASCINVPNNGQRNWATTAQLQQQQVPPFYNPNAGRVPSYPPQGLIDAANNGGTLRSIKSMAANSIASTLLRSKKHAKAMSMAQLNHQQDKNNQITSFHQPQSHAAAAAAATMGGPLMMMPPVPPMFLPNLPSRSILNGSQTMKPQSKSAMLPYMGHPQMNFESMTPKEMKKLLRKNAKYGLDQVKPFGENGLPPLPMRGPPSTCHISQATSKSGTMVSQPMFLDMYGNGDLPMMPPDAAHIYGMNGNPMPPPPPPIDPSSMMGSIDQAAATMKPILVKPNPEFLKSKAGKKWLKQQKEFKKLLPPHLDGLPIIFGPPPVDALEPVMMPPPPQLPPMQNGLQAPTFLPPPPLPHPSLPMMDSSGYYNSHPFYGQNGRASAASTLLRYSPNNLQIMHDNPANGAHHLHPHDGSDYMQRNHHQSMFNSSIHNGPQHLTNSQSSSMLPGHRDYLLAAGDNSSMVFGNGHIECGIDVPHQRNPHHHLHRDNVQGQQQQQKRHMVEQSVISLGDENDYEDYNEEEEADTEEYRDSGQHNGYYSASINNQEPMMQSEIKSRSKSTQAATNNKMMNRNTSAEHSNYQQYDQQQQQAYGQVAVAADDQGSFSSGIYKRGHLNERAFSYSIRQELHKSTSSNKHTTEPEYIARNETSVENGRLDQLQQQQCHMSLVDNQTNSQTNDSSMFHAKHDQNDEYYQHHPHHNNNNDPQNIPVNELTHRLENQLNMKSFSNSRIKSHM